MEANKHPFPQNSDDLIIHQTAVKAQISMNDETTNAGQWKMKWEK